MMTLVKRTLIGFAILSAVLSALAGGTRSADAATGYEQWYGPATDGCFYLWDGWKDVEALCARTDAGYNHYVLTTAGWVFNLSLGWYDNGQSWATFADGNWIVMNADGSLYSTSFQTSNTSSAGLGGFIDWSNPNIQNAMNDPLVAGMLIKMDDSYNDMIDNILAPTCYGYVYGDTCYE